MKFTSLYVLKMHLEKKAEPGRSRTFVMYPVFSMEFGILVSKQWFVRSLTDKIYPIGTVMMLKLLLTLWDLDHFYMRPEVNSNRFKIPNLFEKSFGLQGDFTAIL